ncbi:MAG: shikimate dehydrogenase [Bacillota bacterium]
MKVLERPLINGKTKVVGIFGDPVEHTFSPAMHNAAFTALKLNFVYLPFRVKKEELPAAVTGLRALGLAGVNITVPHKEAVLPYLDEITSEARLIGAVNTVVNRNGRLTGYNTDATGFLRAFREAGFEPAGAEAVVLGAGGAARAVCMALGMAGVRRITVFNRTYERAQTLARDVQANTKTTATALHWEELNKEGAGVIRAASAVVQTTSMGMHPEETACPAVPPTAFRKNQLVVDLIYNPEETQFLRTAAGAGATTQNGMKMLLYQGAEAFELWTGSSPPVEVMLRGLEECRKTN